jgi:hypothetical protein
MAVCAPVALLPVVFAGPVNILSSDPIPFLLLESSTRFTKTTYFKWFSFIRAVSGKRFLHGVCSHNRNNIGARTAGLSG